MTESKEQRQRDQEARRKLEEENYLLDYGPSQEPIWQRSNRMTAVALELGIITEEDIVDE